MKTASKIVALLGVGASTDAFFTEMFNSEDVQVSANQANSFSESLYSATDFMYYNWYNGYTMPVYGYGYDYGYFTGPYGGDAFGFYYYEF